MSNIRRLSFHGALVTCLMMVALVGAVVAGPLEDGLEAYKRQDYATALRLFRPLADMGNADAQTNLGLMYERGDGVARNDAEAVKLYRLAAAQGNANGQSNLGGMYAAGRGVPQDYAESIKWHRLAAAQGRAAAQFNLGFRYSRGQGVPQDEAEAVGFYRLAADQRYAIAQFNLAQMYATGRGVQQDYVQAHMWFDLAFSAFPESERRLRDLARSLRDGVAAVMTPMQIAEAKKMAREWKPPTR